jgi:hypothetical protein
MEVLMSRDDFKEMSDNGYSVLVCKLMHASFAKLAIDKE